MNKNFQQKVFKIFLLINKEVHIKVTRVTEYGERYKLFVVEKNSFEKKYNFEDFGINLAQEKDGKVVIDKLNWKGQAKKNGIQLGDIISNLKIENPDRPNKAIVYPFALIKMIIFDFEDL